MGSGRTSARRRCRFAGRGGWLLHLAGMPTRQIVRRSSGLFFLTSAINVLMLDVGGLLLLLGVGERPSRPAARRRPPDRGSRRHLR